MKCHEARKLFPLYYDSEGDAEVQLHIGDHLAMCPDCRAWFEREARVQDALTGLIARGDVDEAMWRRIETAVVPRRAAQPRNPLHAGIAVLAVSLAIAIGLTFWLANGGDNPSNVHLSRLAAVEHDRYVKGDWQATLASDSVEEVEGWLREHAGFAVRCPPQGRRGFRLQGGGVCRLHGEASAHIVGDIDGKRISIFVLNGSSLPVFPELQTHLARAGQIHQCHEDPYDMVATQRHGHVVIVMGESDVDALREVLLGYGSHHSQEQQKSAARRFPAARRLVLATQSKIPAERLI